MSDIAISSSPSFSSSEVVDVSEFDATEGDLDGLKEDDEVGE